MVGQVSDVFGEMLHVPPRKYLTSRQAPLPPQTGTIKHLLAQSTWYWRSHGRCNLVVGAPGACARPGHGLRLSEQLATAHEFRGFEPSETIAVGSMHVTTLG